MNYLLTSETLSATMRFGARLFFIGQVGWNLKTFLRDTRTIITLDGIDARKDFVPSRGHIVVQWILIVLGISLCRAQCGGMQMVTQVSNREVILLDMNVLFIMHIIKSKEDDIPCLFSPNRSLFKTLPENALALETAGYLPTFAAFVWCFSFDFIF